MFKFSVMYPFEKGARFDFDYYRTKHMDLVQKQLRPFGLVKVEIDKGVPGRGDVPPPYVCVGNLYFSSREGFEKGIVQAGPMLRADIPNFTSIAPTRMFSEVLE
jgi:uncharacterized protein (TIGR02118 family)